MKGDLINKFEVIYEKESNNVFRFCFVRVSSKEQALDLTQETFLRFWQTMSSGQEIRNHRAFIFTVARRLIIDWYRKKKNITQSDLARNSNDENEEQDDIFSNKTNFEDIMIKAEGRYLLEKINDLPPSYREPIYLRFVEDLSPSEIGQIMGISENAASVRINRGMLALKKNTGYSDNFLNKNDKK